MKPQAVFSIIRADEVAECWEGVGEELYKALWAIASIQRPIPNIEDSGPHDHIGHECLADYWHELTLDHQIRLNELAAERDREFKASMRAAGPL